MSKALEIEKKKTDDLLHEMLPSKVATELLAGRHVDAGNPAYTRKNEIKFLHIFWEKHLKNLYILYVFHMLRTINIILVNIDKNNTHREQWDNSNTCMSKSKT